MLLSLFLIIVAYLLGSLSSAIIICRLLGLADPRTQGSESAGATNVLRMADKKTTLMVLAGDVLKGLLAVLLARLCGLSGGILAWVALAAVIGHVFPLFFGFKGGKGVATALGGLLGIAWPLAIIAVMIWLIVAKIYRYSSLAALSATGATPFVAILFAPSAFIPLILLAAFIAWTHRDNIQRLRAGEESKINW